MSVKVTNNATTTLAASLSTGATTATLLAASGLAFPVLAAGDWFWATLQNAAGVIEIVKVTAHVGDTMTIVRAQDGTAAATWNPGDKFELRPTAALFNDKLGVVDAAATYSPIATSLQVTGKNRIINGAATVNQRPYNSASAVTGNTSSYGGMDRWACTNGSGGGTIAQTLGGITWNGVPHNAIKQTATVAATTLTAANYWSGLFQSIEQCNCYDLVGQPVSISFVFQASNTGTYPVSLRVVGGTAYSCVTTFNYTTAGAPQYVTITFPAIPTAAAFSSGTSAGMYLHIGGMNTSTYSTVSTNAWVTGAFITTTGATSWGSTVGAYISATLVQVEAGTSSTPFERLKYNEILNQCRRYCYVIGDGTGTEAVATALVASTTGMFGTVIFPVQMRTKSPTLITSGMTGTTSSQINSGTSQTTGYNSLDSLVYELTCSGATAWTGSQAGIIYAVNGYFALETEL